MNRFRNYVLTAAGFAVLATVVGVFSAGPAIAQLAKAALVKNVDEKGRVPWQLTLTTNSCPFPGCFITFPAVPAGKRLVIEYGSGLVQQTSSTLSLPAFVLLNEGAFPQARLGPFVPNVSPQSAWILSATLLYYVEEGRSPQILSSSATPVSYVEATISGYLIDKSI